jgi:hypothetical protein
VDVKSLGEILWGLLPYGFWLLFVRMALRPNGEKLVGKFCEAAAVDLSDPVRGQVKQALVGAVRIRRAMFLLGPTCWATAALLVRIEELSWSRYVIHPLTCFGLYLVGGVIGSLTMRLPDKTGVARQALLSPRRLADYLPMWIVWTARVALVLVVVVGVAVVANRNNWAYQPRHYDIAGVVWLIVGACCALALFETYSRMLLARPQVVTGADSGVAGEALRLLAVRRAGRAVVTFTVGAVGAQFWALGHTFDNGWNFAGANLCRGAGASLFVAALIVFALSSDVNSSRAPRLRAWANQ